MKNTSKKIYLEIIRIIALLCIIYNHTGPRGNGMYLFTSGNFTFAVSLITDIFCRIGVPLFLMVSGALLPAKEESLQQTYRKRAFRIIKVIIVFTMIRYFYECFYTHETAFSMTTLMKAILTGNLFVPYWFLYTYLSILLLLPFFKHMVKDTEKEMPVFLILIGIFYVIMPVVSVFSGWNFEIFPMLGLNFCYFILGYYIDHILKQSFTPPAAILACGTILGSIAFTGWLVIHDKSNGRELTDTYSSLLTPLIAVSVFWIIKAVFEESDLQKEHTLLTTYILHLGSCCFGIYLIEDYLRNGLAFIYDSCCPYLTAMPACAIWLLAVLLTGTVIVSLLKKLPVLKALL